jgi:hypothetical protein
LLQWLTSQGATDIIFLFFWDTAQLQTGSTLVDDTLTLTSPTGTNYNQTNRVKRKMERENNKAKLTFVQSEIGTRNTRS